MYVFVTRLREAAAESPDTVGKHKRNSSSTKSLTTVRLQDREAAAESPDTLFRTRTISLALTNLQSLLDCQ